jgi:hypothetical protein
VYNSPQPDPNSQHKAATNAGLAKSLVQTGSRPEQGAAWLGRFCRFIDSEQEFNGSMNDVGVVGTWYLVSVIARSSGGDEFLPYGKTPAAS